jgi:energy-coupling factor transporter ATP-binding protein EcfA2
VTSGLKRIDFHIHTKSGLLPDNDVDADIAFSIDALRDATSKASLDGIAITNHNVFDKEHYEAIRDALDVTVFPGIELNVEKTHTIVASAPEYVDQIVVLADAAEQKMQNGGASFSVEEFKNAIGTTSHFLVVPHYRKRPQIADATLNAIRKFARISDGVIASTKLNVILGTRSSGKTFLLGSIEKAFGKNNVKYVKQFDLAKEAGEEEVLKAFADNNSQLVEKHRRPMKDITDLYLRSSLCDSNAVSADYVEQLQDWANAQRDVFSSCRLYSAPLLRETPATKESEVLDAVLTLLNSDVYINEIDEAIDKDKLLDLLRFIVVDLKVRALHNRLILAANSAIGAIQKSLSSRSETPAFPAVFDIVDTMRKHLEVERYYSLVEKSWATALIEKHPLGRYFVRFTRKKYANANRMKSVLANKASLQGICQNQSSESYITDCRGSGVSDSELYRVLFDVELSAVDELGNNLSGGQWSELLLLERLKEAETKDALLLDEPEGSFDNPFLNTHIIEQIRRLADKATVFMVTHNNNLGASINPDVFFYTTKEGASFDVLSACLGDVEFRSQSTGATKRTYDVLVDNLEAGEGAYTARRALYESSRN